MPAPIYLTKSRYTAGLQCLLRLWLDVHDPGEREEPKPGSAADVGNEIGRMAHLLFPGGALVEEKPWEHEAAVERTSALMANRAVPAIFEAAFEHRDVRVRIDILERLPGGWWGIREVKSSGDVKDHHYDDVAVQLHVARSSGARISSVEVLHVDKDYVRGTTGVSWPDFFRRADVRVEATSRLAGIEARLKAQIASLSRSKAPAVEPEAHCHAPYSCGHWERCIATKPADWIYHLPRLRAEKREELKKLGIKSISVIPEEFPLSKGQAVIRDATKSGRTFVAPDLADRLDAFGPPAVYLDFETFMPAVPVYPGTRPFEVIPFQWSLHRVDGRRKGTHREFLADGGTDPRRAFAETLIAALEETADPIIVYSAYEQTRLKELAAAFPDLRKPIASILARLSDLLPAVRACVYHPGFRFSHSIKSVAPALCPDVTYEDLDEIADGESASMAFWLIASGRADAPTAKRLRRALRAYCKRDTWAMVRLHQALRDLAAR